MTHSHYHPLHAEDRRTDGSYRPTLPRVFFMVIRNLAERSTCPDGARHGALLARDQRILATGYGSPAIGEPPCEHCFLREEHKKTGKKNWELCQSVHAEANVLLMSARYGIPIIGSELYCTRKPCNACIRLLVNAGVARCHHLTTNGDGPLNEWATLPLANKGLS